jgi:hypothetical protein
LNGEGGVSQSRNLTLGNIHLEENTRHLIHI